MQYNEEQTMEKNLIIIFLGECTLLNMCKIGQ